AAIILGSPLPAGDRVTIHILGVHEQVNRNGLISTIIATTDVEANFESLEKRFTGALGVIEAGLVQLQGSGSRSLGFRSEKQALQTIQRYRKSYRADG
ncbi:MAG: hypothetical protein HOE54_09215, partial [Gammaproteobacteria bacterium]|nr:hypothetical protein [Gammaproteobacteria bacterium]